jgi:hypothetical protein
VQRGESLIGDAVDAREADFGCERKHGAKDFAERSDVVRGDPASEFEESRVENGGWVEDLDDGLNVDGLVAVVEFDDDASESLLAGGDADAYPQ